MSLKINIFEPHGTDKKNVIRLLNLNPLPRNVIKWSDPLKSLETNA